MSSNDNYFRTRALEELKRAASAAAPDVAAIHRQLAEKYQTLVCMLEIEASSPAEGERPNNETPA
jgi:hypothetical protein